MQAFPMVISVHGHIPMNTADHRRSCRFSRPVSFGKVRKLNFPLNALPEGAGAVGDGGVARVEILCS